MLYRTYVILSKRSRISNNIRLPRNISGKAGAYLEEEETPLDEVWELEVEPESELEVIELELLERLPEIPEDELPKSELLPSASGITSSEITPSG